MQYYPEFLDDHPFYWPANNEMRKLNTVRGMQVEFGDQHEYAYVRRFSTNTDTVRKNEQLAPFKALLIVLHVREYSLISVEIVLQQRLHSRGAFLYEDWMAGVGRVLDVRRP